MRWSSSARRAGSWTRNSGRCGGKKRLSFLTFGWGKARSLFFGDKLLTDKRCFDLGERDGKGLLNHRPNRECKRHGYYADAGKFDQPSTEACVVRNCACKRPAVSERFI